ncbi:hypothetical protein DRN98_09700 [Methanosarcinales archaeon]|nr:MAG: hypothetical protein DRN98_09700 [Methanosarcinales archaeon]
MLTKPKGYISNTGVEGTTSLMGPPMAGRSRKSYTLGACSRARSRVGICTYPRGGGINLCGSGPGLEGGVDDAQTHEGHPHPDQVQQRYVPHAHHEALGVLVPELRLLLSIGLVVVSVAILFFQEVFAE